MSSFAINGVTQAEYTYNAQGQQVIRRLTQEGDLIHVIHDLDGNRIAEYLYDEASQISTLLREYVWMEDVVVAVIENDTVYFVRTDHIGRPVFATNDVGVKVWEASYLPFGGVQSSFGPAMDLRFPGQWFQSESGLHQNWMRDCDPTTGRYIQGDPLGLVDGASVYGYALQNPGKYTDPTGQFVPFAIFAASAAVGIYVDYQLKQCGCNSHGAVERWTGFGAAAAEFGPTKPKRNVKYRDKDGRKYRPKRVKNSSKYTSRMSERVAKSHLGGKPGSWNQQYRSGARAAGKNIAKRLPAVGTAFALYDGARLAKCWGYW